jgi:predicted anti-sigma-YlaC factor YlaD
MKLRYSCREASRLLTAREDEGLPFMSAVVLRMHLLACTNCTNFSDQMRKLTELMRDLPAAGAPSDKR